MNILAEIRNPLRLFDATLCKNGGKNGIVSENSLSKKKKKRLILNTISLAEWQHFLLVFLCLFLFTRVPVKRFDSGPYTFVQTVVLRSAACDSPLAQYFVTA